MTLIICDKCRKKIVSRIVPVPTGKRQTFESDNAIYCHRGEIIKDIELCDECFNEYLKKMNRWISSGGVEKINMIE